MPKRVIAFPQMDNYYIPVQFLLTHITSCDILLPPKITAKTIELGTKYSPEFVCTPFKYTLGTYIECLEKGADTLIQAGGGCRYGYYAELQEKILTDLGYKFDYLNLVSSGNTDIKKIYRCMKQLDPNFSVTRGLYYLFLTSKMIRYMDKMDDYIRSNIGFEVKKGSFERERKKMLHDFLHIKSYYGLRKCYKKYKKRIKQIEIDKPKDCLKIGIIGELYTVMEPFSNYFLERELARMGIEIKRYTNVHYLLFEKGRMVKKYLRQTKEYIKYRMGADAADNIARTKYLCKHGYDGIIHIKSAFCTPEIGAMPIITKICNEYHVPVIFFSFDSNTSEVGIKTRLEAFYDMLEMRKKHENWISRN